MKHVAVLIETSREYGRGLLEGVSRYHREHGDWSIYFRPRGQESALPEWLRDWSGDGILARISSRELADTILASGAPVVDLSGIYAEELKAPFIGIDNEAVAEMACEYLLGRGFKRIGIANWDSGYHPHLDQRCDAVARRLQKKIDVLDFRLGDPRRMTTSWEERQDMLAQTLQENEHPFAIFCTHDDIAINVLDACRRADLRVPEDVAVLGVDNDEYLCAMSMPPLSSIAVNAKQVGYLAADLLDRLMAGERAGSPGDVVAPIEVVTRQSTDIVALDDPHLANALQFIREYGCTPISVDDVVGEVPFSRSLLERRMKAAIGRSPKAEIMRVRLNCAKKLLLGSTLPMGAIAKASGFADAKHLNQVIRTHFNCTPGQLRTSGGSGVS